MPLDNPSPGPQSAVEYATAGLPWVKSINVENATLVGFPKVTRAFTVRNIGSGSIRVGFTENGVQGENYFELPSAESERFEIRIKELYLYASPACSASVMAELTTISERSFPLLTGSLTGSFGGTGWQGVG